MSKDLILGIESSCDDTAAAVVDRDGNVLSSIIASQTHIHAHWGGVSDPVGWVKCLRHMH